jgi:hypothetical protein
VSEYLLAARNVPIPFQGSINSKCLIQQQLSAGIGSVRALKRTWLHQYDAFIDIQNPSQDRKIQSAFL